MKMDHLFANKTQIHFIAKAMKWIGVDRDRPPHPLSRGSGQGRDDQAPSLSQGAGYIKNFITLFYSLNYLI